jgi:hypothetical protein
MALCEITGRIQNLDESPVADAQVRATIQSTDVDQSGQLVAGVGVASEPLVVFSDVTGRFSIPLKQGASVFLEIPAINLARYITVPSVAGPIDVETLI